MGVRTKSRAGRTPSLSPDPRGGAAMTTALADTRRGMTTLLAGILALSLDPAVAQPATPIVVESYLIPSGDAGIQLYVRNKRPGAMTAFRAARTVLYVHGTTQAS